MAEGKVEKKENIRDVFSDNNDFLNRDTYSRKEEFDRIKRVMNHVKNRGIIAKNIGLGEIPFAYAFNINNDNDSYRKIYSTIPLKFKFQAKDEGCEYIGRFCLKQRQPFMEIMDSENEIYITMEIREAEEEDIDVSIKPNDVNIVILGMKEEYHKTISLPCKIKPKSSKITFINGILDITLVKA